MKYQATFKNSLIYIFRINDATHKGCVKIGEATAPDGDIYSFSPNCKPLNDAAKKRIDSYTKTAGIKYELLHTEMSAYSKDGKLLSFNDKAVHDVLLRSNIKKEDFGTNAGEWFHCDLETAKNAIKAVKNGQKCLNKNQKSENQSPITLRDEQLRAIEQTKRVFKKGNKILWNAKMRMGKTVTALGVVKEMKIHKTIIITHRPVVNQNWFEDFDKIFYEKDTNWCYGSKNKGEAEIKKLEQSGKHFVYFASIQDLRGSKRVGGNFNKNDDIFDTDWDLLIIDEAHEGTQTELGKRVREEIIKEKTKVINLSGTPFNLLESNEFNDENTFTWDYVMEQRAKQQWATDHPGDYNPYQELPKLHILTFNLGKLAADFQDEDKAFNFTEFFKTDDKGEFVYKADIANFLDIISSDDGQTLYPFSSEEYREFFHHTFWIVPGVKEGLALAKMLRAHSVFHAYEVVNVCGKEDEETKGDPLEEVHNKITDHPEDTYTITLSCGKLTTGVTVKEWTAVLYLAGSKNTSPSSYMQTIFRVQSPGNIGGKMKTDCYVFDFAPDRTLKMVAATAKISAKAGETDHDDRQILGNFLNFCPIISYDGTQMKPYNVDQMMQQLKRIYVDKVVNTGFDDGHLYSKKLYNLSNIELENFANLRDIIGQTKANPKAKDIDINKEGFDKENLEKAKQKARKEGKKLTKEQLEALAEQLKKRRQRDTAVSILRGISIRMPLLLFGAKLDNEDENITLDRFVELVDDNSWAEFMPLGVTKDRFALYKKYYDEDIFSAAGKQIRQLALAADKMPVLERIQHIAQIFDSFRNPDKETVLTPWRVVNMHLSDTLGGFNFLEDRFIDRGLVTQRLFENTNVKILEINSKSGLYPLYMAYSVFLYRKRVAQNMKRSLFKKLTIEEEQTLWRDVLAENIFVICKTEMARSITQRTLAGFTGAKINTHVYDNLLEQITKNKQEFINTLLSGGIFPKIKNMKFDAIVGNPPYQETKNNTSDNPVYHLFMSISFKLAQRVTFITPARYLFNAGKTPQEFNDKVLNDEHFKVVWYKQKSTDVFPNVDIKGGVAVMYWDEKAIFGKIGSFTAYPELNRIYKKVVKGDFMPLSKIIYTQNKFNLKQLFSEYPNIKLGSDGKERRLTTSIFALKNVFSLNQKNKSDIHILGLVNNNREYRWIKAALIEEHPNLRKYKVIIPKSNGSGSIGEVLSTPLIGEPLLGVTQSFITIGAFETETEAVSALKYIKSKFTRTLLGILKATQDNSKEVWRFVPLQDFTSNSDIDWTKTVSEIDQQLYKKYKLNDDEISFIESMIKPME